MTIPSAGKAQIGGTMKRLVLRKARDIATLEPEEITDKNGVRRTVYVKPDQKASIPRRTPPQPLDIAQLKREIEQPEYKKAVKDFVLGEPICSVVSGLFTGKDVTEKRNNAKAWAAENFKEPIKRDDIGDIIFNERGVDHSLHHDDNTFQNKLDAMTAVPDVIKHGKLIHIENDYEGKPIKNLFLTAPIVVDNKNKLLFVRIRRNAGDPNRFYVHEVLEFPQGAITPITNQKPTGQELYQKLLGDILNKAVDAGTLVCNVPGRTQTPNNPSPSTTINIDGFILSVNNYLFHLYKVQGGVPMKDAIPVKKALLVKKRGALIRTSPAGERDTIPKLLLMKKSLTWSGYPLQDRYRFAGFDISIENKAGSVRRGKDTDGHEWHTKMYYDYGYIRGTEGVDGDHVDCYIGGDEDGKNVYIVHQNDPVTGKYDEDKVMLGFSTLEAARKAYLKQYDRPGFLGSIDTIPLEQFRAQVLDKKQHGKRLHKAHGGTVNILKKAVETDKLDYFKRELLKHLTSLEGKEPSPIKKAVLLFSKGGKGLPVGSIREWKGKKFIKTPSGKWKPKGGTGGDRKEAVKKIAATENKIAVAENQLDLFSIVTENKDLFSDEKGKPLPVVMDLFGEIKTSVPKKKASSKKPATKMKSKEFGLDLFSAAQESKPEKTNKETSDITKEKESMPNNPLGWSDSFHKNLNATLEYVNKKANTADIEYVSGKYWSKTVQETRDWLINRYKKKLGDNPTPSALWDEMCKEINKAVKSSEISIRIKFVDTKQPNKSIYKSLQKKFILRNQFETGTSEGALSKSNRDIWESVIANKDISKMSANDRPIYGAVDVLKNDNMAASQYGRSIIVLKDSVRSRTTFTLGNSSGQQGAFQNDANTIAYKRDRTARYSNPFQAFRGITKNYQYLEAQVWGRAGLDDIAEIRLDKLDYDGILNDPKGKVWLDELRACGIKVNML